jgi:hypothetical protein
MSDWSEIVLCPKCGAANPHDGSLCVRCREQLQEAIKEAERMREERWSRMKKDRRPKGRRNSKPVDGLTPEDLDRFPVWEYDLANEGDPRRDETWVRPVKKIPVTDLGNRVVAATLLLNNGVRLTGCLGNVDLRNEKATRESLILSVWHQDRRIDLVRSIDADDIHGGPAEFARLLGFTLDGVFPIRYDISEFATGLDSVIHGVIEA